ncbi:MAG: hypothetical protein CME61_05605 [Halobacteriovoraceae bacterium]|nr:hypothetical protein [Halobacteriovoraceae bacterium]
MKFIKISAKLIKIKILFIVLTVCVGNDVFSGEQIGVLTKKGGNVFRSNNGKFSPISVGQHIFYGDEIIVELGGSAQIVDYKDRTISLSGSTSLSLFSEKIVLKKGFSWVQLGRTVSTVLETSNSIVEFNEGEGILIFEPNSLESTFLSIDGRASISNKALKEYKTFINPGGFSIVNTEIDMGRPRPETNIGSKSYQKLRELFSFVKVKRLPAQKVKVPVRKIKINREIASEKSKAKIQKLKIEDERIQKNALENELKKYRKKKLTYAYPNVKFNLFKKLKEPSKRRARRPSSVKSFKPNKFQKDLNKAYVLQKKHDDSIRKLVKELKSFKLDYFESY